MDLHERKLKQLNSANISQQTMQFSNGDDVSAIFRSVHDIPLEGLKALRNQITLKVNEQTVSSQDSRLLLVKDWLRVSPGAEDVFRILDNNVPPSISSLCMSIMYCAVTLLTIHYDFQALGQPIIKKLISPRWMEKLESYLSGSHTELCLMSLKVLNAISNFANGKDQKPLMEGLSWNIKLFHKLLYMRRKGKDSVNSNVLSKPDVRTLCLLFILSFLSSRSPSHLKSAFIEQHRDIVLSIFKGLAADPYAVVQYVLELLWTGLWQDPKVKRTLKISIFGENTVQQLLKLYERTSQEGQDVEQVPANVIHHFLLAICTHRGVGLCFADNGWYPRLDGEVIDDVIKLESGQQNPPQSRNGKVFNKILGNVLKMLKISEDARQQELALKILRACPELVSGYLPSIGLTFEPRLSSKWLANIAFLGSVVSLPVPSESFLLPINSAGSSSLSSQYIPTPPLLSTIVENIIPSVDLKLHLTKALQSNSALVRHSASLALVKILLKYGSVLHTCYQIEHALEEDGVNGQWTSRRQALEKEMRRKVPDIQTIVAFSALNNNHAEKGMNVITQHAMLSEVCQRLLWLYHRYLPALVAEARYETGKSLGSFMQFENEDLEENLQIYGFLLLQQLHVLKSLKESDQFIWSSKAGHSTPSNVYILLKLLLFTKHKHIKDELTVLLVQSLQDSPLFQHNSEELYLWLDALPTNVRSPGAETPDGVLLSDEREVVIGFLEECLQRCSKTPYRYLEELDTLRKPIISAYDTKGDARSVLLVEDASSASPVIATMLEQFIAKIKSRLLSPSDALAILTYIRRVILNLVGLQSDLALCKNLSSKLREVVTDEDAMADSQCIATALRKEIGILEDCIKSCIFSKTGPTEHTNVEPSSAITSFVERVEHLPYEGDAAVIHAYELVDWLRLIEGDLDPDTIKRVVAIIKRFYAPALTSFYSYLSPNLELIRYSFADGSNVMSSSSIPVSWLLYIPTYQFSFPEFCSVLTSALQDQQIPLHLYKSLAGLFMHRINQNPDNIEDIMNALATVLGYAKASLPFREFVCLKNFIWEERQCLRNLSCDSQSQNSTSLVECLIPVLFDPDSDGDRALLQSVCTYWITFINNSLQMSKLEMHRGAIIWLKFMNSRDILNLIERVSETLVLHKQGDGNCLMLLPFLKEALTVLVQYCQLDVTQWMSKNLPNLLILLRCVPAFEVLDKVIALSVDASIPIGHDGLMRTSGLASLSKLVHIADLHWSSRLDTIPQEISILPLLNRDDWTQNIADTIAAFVYKSAGARETFWKWLSSNGLSGTPSISFLAPSVHAVIDTSFEGVPQSGDPLISKLFDSLSNEFFVGAAGECEMQIYLASLVKIIRHDVRQRATFMKNLEIKVAQMSVHILHEDVLHLASALVKLNDGLCGPFLNAVIDHALQWAVRYLSDNLHVNDIAHRAFAELACLIKTTKQVSAHYAEPVMSTVLRSHLLQSCLVSLTEYIFCAITLKPVSVNRYLQSILQHPDFEKLSTSTSAKEAVVKVLFAMFTAHPSKTCHPSHIQPLVQIYSGTLSSADRHILAIFHLYECEKKSSVASSLLAWSAQGSFVSQSPLDIVSNLDSSTVFRTCLNFPIRRTLSVGAKQELSDTAQDDNRLYDPVFILLLVSQVLVENSPQSARDWVRLYRANVVSLCIRCLSSVDSALRQLALLQLSLIWSLMPSIDMYEKQQLKYIFDLLRHELPASSDGTPPRLSSYISLLLAHSIRGIFYPANFMYPITARFLLQRPKLDLYDIPLLYGLLYSSSDDWKKERGWIIKFLADGMLGYEDWRLLKRRHAWDLLASLYQGSYEQRAVRHGILEALANLTCNSRATTSLLLKSSLVQWMEVQIKLARHDEHLAWTKIIENIVVVVDHKKLEQANKGEWQSGLLRCLNCFLRTADLNLLRLISRILLRLDSGHLNASQCFLDTLNATVDQLLVLEMSPTITLSMQTGHSSEMLPPHRSHLLQHMPSEPAIQVWGCTVEGLWYVSMKCVLKSKTWDKLSSRLLVWRSLVGESKSEIGEWARLQSVYLLRKTY